MMWDTEDTIHTLPSQLSIQFLTLQLRRNYSIFNPILTLNTYLYPYTYIDAHEHRSLSLSLNLVSNHGTTHSKPPPSPPPHFLPPLSNNLLSCTRSYTRTSTVLEPPISLPSPLRIWPSHRPLARLRQVVHSLL